jgi:hypothetical protein
MSDDILEKNIERLLKKAYRPVPEEQVERSVSGFRRRLEPAPRPNRWMMPVAALMLIAVSVAVIATLEGSAPRSDDPIIPLDASMPSRTVKSDPLYVGWNGGWTVHRYSITKDSWETWKSPDDKGDYAIAAVGPIGAVVLKKREGYSGWFFDLRRQKWQAVPEAPMPGPPGILDSIQISFVDHRVLVWGYGPGDPHGALLDTRTLKWTAIPEAPVPPRYRAVYGMIGKKFAVWGGYRGQPGLRAMGAEVNPTSDGALYDAAGNAWTTMPDAPMGYGYGASGATWRNGMVILCDKGSAILDPSSAKWTPLEGCPVKRLRHVTCAVSGKTLFVWSSTGEGFLCDLKSKRWTEIPKAPIRPRSMANVHVSGSKIIVWGGWASRFQRSGAIFDIRTRAWTKIAKPPGDTPKALHPGW